jgi:hypothetical protein
LHHAARAKGGVCLSSAYTTSSVRYAFRCAQGHEWLSQGAIVLRGGWCRRCANIERGLKRRHTDGLQKLQAAARAKGGVCLATAYVDGNTRYAMRCSAGHEWDAVGHSVFTGQWCARCVNDARRLSLADAQALAHGRGGRCLSQQYVNNEAPMTWECHRGHTWRARYSNIASGTWCPECAHMAKISNRHSKARLRYVASLRHGGEGT